VNQSEYHLGKYFLEEVESNLYKWISELIHPLQQYIYSSTILRMKGEDSCLKDKLLDGGMRGKDNKGIGYREVRQYHTDFYFLQFEDEG
jgi:hypothetical protein